MLKFLIGVTFFFRLSFADTVQQKADLFFKWLQQNEKTFTDCQINKKDDLIILCDQTQVSYSELKKLFQKNKSDLIENLKSKKIKIEVICDQTEKLSNENCVLETSNNTFKKVSQLHGLYLPDENKIIVRSSATVGTLIHEYLHYLQSSNVEKVNGHIYKSEKNQLRRDIEQELDRMLVEIKNLEQKKDITHLKIKAAEFMKLNEYMLAFGKWQDLIDERSLFLLFLKYQSDFKIADADMALAKKNIKYICNRKEFVGKLSKAECAIE